ncbi:unnamed protein product [Parajaminaea phylloscopi]
MKVLNPRSALLSDYEMLSLLREMDEEQHSGAEGQALSEAKVEEAMKKVPDNLRTVQYETLSLLTQPTRSCAFQTDTYIQEFQAALKLAGFIGGRRGLAPANGSPSSGAKRKPARKTGGRKTKRSKHDDGDEHMSGDEDEDEDEDGDDPATVSPTLAPSDLAGASELDLSHRGPEEILPDRALTKAERLQIVNHAPRSLVDLHVLVEELSMRFTEGQIMELLTLVHTYLPLPATEDEAEMQEAQEAPQDPGHGHDEGEGGGYDAGHEGAGEEHNGLFMGGADETFVAGDEDEDADAWANEAGGANNDDLAGDGANDDDET